MTESDERQNLCDNLANLNVFLPSFEKYNNIDMLRIDIEFYLPQEMH